MKLISEDLGRIIAALAAIALLVCCVTAFRADINGFFDSIVNKETSIAEDVLGKLDGIDLNPGNVGIGGSGSGDSGSDGSGSEEQNGPAPGLYDADDNMVASWDTLVNTYKMDIEKDYTSSSYKTDAASPYYVLQNEAALSAGVKLVVGNVSKIGAFTFYRDTKLSDLVVLEGVTDIGQSAFQFSKIVNVTLSDSVVTLGDCVFMNCANLKNVSLAKVEKMGFRAFSDSGIESIHIPGTVSEFGTSVFGSCQNLKTVTIGEGVESIGASMFSNCPFLSSITLPSSLTKIENKAFYMCTRLVDCNLPEGLTEIGDSAFGNCSWLETLRIPSTVCSIGKEAFIYCYSLTSVEFADTTTWYYTSTAGATSGGTEIDVSDPVANKGHLNSTYKSYYWYKA